MPPLAPTSMVMPLERRTPGEADLRLFGPELLPPGRHRLVPARPGLRVVRCGPAGRPVLAPPDRRDSARGWSSVCSACGGLRWVKGADWACWDCGAVSAPPSGGGVAAAHIVSEPPLSPRERYGARRSLDEARDPAEGRFL